MEAFGTEPVAAPRIEQTILSSVTRTEIADRLEAALANTPENPLYGLGLPEEEVAVVVNAIQSLHEHVGLLRDGNMSIRAFGKHFDSFMAIVLMRKANGYSEETQAALRQWVERQKAEITAYVEMARGQITSGESEASEESQIIEDRIQATYAHLMEFLLR